MKEYRRLKSIDGSDSVTRYYELDDDTAYTNVFYKIASNKATKIAGQVSGADLIGFSFGGNVLVDGCILLDVNDHAVYMALLDENDARPNIGDLVNGYQRVIDIHYDGDENVSGKGTNPAEWGIEEIDNPYYLFVIEQPTAENTETVTDTDAGTVTPGQKKTE